MLNYLKLIVVGNLGREPEVRYTPTGQPVANLSVAVNRSWPVLKDGQPVFETDELGNKRQKFENETIWVRGSLWGPQAERIKGLKTGQTVLMDGRLIPDPKTGGPRTFTRQDGTVGASFEMHVDVLRYNGAAVPNGEPIPF